MLQHISMSEIPPPLPSSPPPHEPEEPIEDILLRKFPNMRPGKSPPVLFRMYGCGFAMFGNRDVDYDTCTYIKSYGLTLLWIPIFSLSAYRVADAESDGWHFLGKESLSKSIRWFNFAVFAIIGF